MILSAGDLCVGYSDKELLTGVSFMIQDADKIGVIGDNGCGKSSLFSAILDGRTLLKGKVDKKSNLKIAVLEQQFQGNHNVSVWEFVAGVGKELYDLEREIHQLTQKLAVEKNYEEIHQLANLQEKFEALGGFVLDSKIKSVLVHLNFNEESWDLPLRSLSGGQLARLQLAKVLLSDFDLLLLDEPTNHLDFVMISWLEKYLTNLRKPYMVISHNRGFLDKVTTKLFHLHHKRLRIYNGNFNHFQEEFALLCGQQKKRYNLQQKEISKTKDFIARNMAGQKTKQAASRLKTLNKMEILEKPQEERGMLLAFNGTMRTGEKVIECLNLSVGYQDKVVVGDINLLLSCGDRVALIGKNGCGKSTFLSTICGKLPLLSGEVKQGSNLKIGYFEQSNYDFPLEQTVLQSIWDLMPGEPIGKPLSYLAAYEFIGDDVERKISTLSGGEKSRLHLARLILQNPNFLVLDEPTNHLDLKMILALENALSAYKGSLLFVCHDKYFVDKLATKFWIFSDNTIKESLDCDYENFVYEKRKKTKKEIEKPKNQRVNPHKLQAMEQEIFEIEERLDSVRNELEDNYALLSDKKVYQNKELLENLHNKIAEQKLIAKSLEKSLEEKETVYLKLC